MRRPRTRLKNVLVVIASTSALAFGAQGSGFADFGVGRVLVGPDEVETTGSRTLVSPSDVSVSLSASSATSDQLIPEALASADTPDQVPKAAPAAPVVIASRTVPTGSDVAAASTTTIRERVASESTSTPPTSTTAAPVVVTTSTGAPGTTAAPTTTVAPPADDEGAGQPTQAPGGWVNPSATGHRVSTLHQFPAANDGPFGVTIDQSFINANTGAAWLSFDGGRPVISGADAGGRCLNILTTVTLRDSYVNCPTRVQNDSWGYPGAVDDAPAVNVLGASNVIIEYNTITCSGSDGDICEGSVRLGGDNALVQYNDLSFGRGAVSMFSGAVFRFNYVHDLSFGFDPNRAGNPNDNVTHNNVANNLGYANTLIQGNYIVARYGRVSAQPSTYRSPIYHGVYANGIVEVGDPINGFTFANYLQRGNGSNYRLVENYIEGSGRPFRCNSSNQYPGTSCAQDISRNVFAADYFDGFMPEALFHDKDGAGSISGSCNVRAVNGGHEILPSNSFGPSNTHVTSGC
ncbi:MAG: hypothetical protein ACR2P0_06270 [Acidimicrobiales bacterium]